MSKWHLMKLGQGMICYFDSQERGQKWLDKQHETYPNGYFNDCYITDDPDKQPEMEPVQLSLF